MTFDEAYDDKTAITYEHALAEVLTHCADFSEFTREYGIATNYKSRDVLEWLGY